MNKTTYGNTNNFYVDKKIDFQDNADRVSDVVNINDFFQQLFPEEFPFFLDHLFESNYSPEVTAQILHVFLAVHHGKDGAYLNELIKNEYISDVYDIRFDVEDDEVVLKIIVGDKQIQTIINSDTTRHCFSTYKIEESVILYVKALYKAKMRYSDSIEMARPLDLSSVSTIDYTHLTPEQFKSFAKLVTSHDTPLEQAARAMHAFLYATSDSHKNSLQADYNALQGPYYIETSFSKVTITSPFGTREISYSLESINRYTGTPERRHKTDQIYIDLVDQAVSILEN